MFRNNSGEVGQAINANNHLEHSLTEDVESSIRRRSEVKSAFNNDGDGEPRRLETCDKCPIFM